MNVIIIGLAILFDLFGLIPIIGVVANPMFGFILYLTYGSKKKDFGLKMAGAAGISALINIIGDVTVILSWLPTNLGQAVYAIILNRKK